MTIAVITENTTPQDAPGSFGAPDDQYSGVSDARLSEQNNTTNDGTGFRIDVSKWSSGDHYVSLLKFDLSSLPSGITITSAKLQVQQWFGNGASTNTVAAYQVLRDWNVSQVTWDDYATSSAWTTGGARGSGTDRASSAEDSTVVSTTSGAWFEWDLTSLVQSWVDGTANYGVVLDRVEAGNDASNRVLESSNGDDSDRPELWIEYTTVSIGDLVQSKQNSGGTATITLDSAPTSGNLLIYGTVSGNSGATLSTPPSGFTEITSHTSADYSSWWGYKISDGTETARNHAWSAGNGYSLYAEYYWQEGTPRVQSNEDTSNVTADGTGPQSSGSVTPHDLTTNLCLAFITSRYQPSSDGSGAFSNSYNADVSFAATPTIAGTAIASLANASGSTSSSYSWSDAGIDTYGAIAAFSPPGAGGGLLPLLNAYYS